MRENLFRGNLSPTLSPPRAGRERLSAARFRLLKHRRGARQPRLAKSFVPHPRALNYSGLSRFSQLKDDCRNFTRSRPDSAPGCCAAARAMASQFLNRGVKYSFQSQRRDEMSRNPLQKLCGPDAPGTSAGPRPWSRSTVSCGFWRGPGREYRLTRSASGGSRNRAGAPPFSTGNDLQTGRYIPLARADCLPSNRARLSDSSSTTGKLARPLASRTRAPAMTP